LHLSADEIKGLGGGCEAAFFVDWKLGYSPGENLTGPLITGKLLDESICAT